MSVDGEGKGELTGAGINRPKAGWFSSQNLSHFEPGNLPLVVEAVCQWRPSGIFKVD